MQLLLIPSPRTLILAQQDYLLIFKQPPPETQGVAVVLELVHRGEVDLDQAVVLNGRVGGCLGVLHIANETFLPIITSSTPVGTRTRFFSGIGTDPIHSIKAVEFYCLSSPIYDFGYSPSSAIPTSSTSNPTNSLTNTQQSSEESFDHFEDSNQISSGYSSSKNGGRGDQSYYPTSSTSTSTSYTSNGGGPGQEVNEHPCAGIKKILSNQNFYFINDTSTNTGNGNNRNGGRGFDLSTRLEVRLREMERDREKEKEEEDDLLGDGDGDEDVNEKGKEKEVESLGREEFLWNTYLLAPLLSFRLSLPPLLRSTFDSQSFLILCIQGFVGVSDVSLAGEPAVLSVISRLGWKRAGTRFNVRGVDDEGNTANFVETETVLRLKEVCFGYTQIRGSVPVFWEEKGQPFAQISITRPLEASLPSFLRHMNEILSEYHSIHIVNLLSAKDQEALLTECYKNHLREGRKLMEDDGLGGDKVGWTEFDFHARSKMGGIESVKGQLATAVGNVVEQFGSTLISVDEQDEKNNTILVSQRGVFRTNCKDCLDRTNVVEDVLSRFALEDFIQQTVANAGSEVSLWNAHRTLFAENGDALSKIYVGTGALNTSFTRSGKKSFAGMLSDATKSMGRMVQSNFLDGGKQKAIDALLGHLSTSVKVRCFNPTNDALHKALKERSNEFTSFEPFTIWVGTYNLNGKSPGNESLLPWLFPDAGTEPAILVIAFQEIVPLSPGQIMATDPEKKRRWEAFILKTVAERPGKKEDYILLRSAQLVGTALVVLIQKGLADEVRNVEAATKKTGLKGMAGNKGAVAIRLDFRDTSLCFLTAHLAAGHNNFEERNTDYNTIAEGLHFARGKSIASHDNIIWASDTNYRISLPNDEVRRLAESDDYAALYAADQLALCMRTRNVFQGYFEAPILFRPTYKYDNGTDVYDSSEKQRIPAWTDRILYSGRDLDLSRYQRSELLLSDHRPVYATLRARIRSIDHKKRSALRAEILAQILARLPTEKADNKLVSLSSAVVSEKGNLPPPSDDFQQWWNLPVLLDPATFPSVLDPQPANPFEDDATPPATRRPPPAIPAKPAVKESPAPSNTIKRKPPPPPEPILPESLN